MHVPLPLLLSALDGVAYVVDAIGTILAIGPPAWDKFAIENSWTRGESNQVVGRNLFSFIEGADVRRLALDLHAEVIAGKRPQVRYPYRCDAPDRKRHMRMSISSLELSGRTVALYQSQLLSETERPWIDIFDPRASEAYLRAQAELPIVTLCSFCRRVSMPSTGMWVDPEQYYRGGGSSRVAVSHGVCPTCYRIITGDEGVAAQGSVYWIANLTPR